MAFCACPSWFAARCCALASDFEAALRISSSAFDSEFIACFKASRWAAEELPDEEDLPEDDEEDEAEALWLPDCCCCCC